MTDRTTTRTKSMIAIAVEQAIRAAERRGRIRQGDGAWGRGGGMFGGWMPGMPDGPIEREQPIPQETLDIICTAVEQEIERQLTLAYEAETKAAEEANQPKPEKRARPSWLRVVKDDDEPEAKKQQTMITDHEIEEVLADRDVRRAAAKASREGRGPKYRCGKGPLHSHLAESQLNCAMVSTGRRPDGVYCPNPHCPGPILEDEAHSDNPPGLESQPGVEVSDDISYSIVRSGGTPGVAVVTMDGPPAIKDDSDHRCPHCGRPYVQGMAECCQRATPVRFWAEEGAQAVVDVVDTICGYTPPAVDPELGYPSPGSFAAEEIQGPPALKTCKHCGYTNGADHVHCRKCHRAFPQDGEDTGG